MFSIQDTLEGIALHEAEDYRRVYPDAPIDLPLFDAAVFGLSSVVLVTAARRVRGESIAANAVRETFISLGARAIYRAGLESVTYAGLWLAERRYKPGSMSIQIPLTDLLERSAV